jgi:hypothetical protein
VSPTDAGRDAEEAQDASGTFDSFARADAVATGGSADATDIDVSADVVSDAAGDADASVASTIVVNVTGGDGGAGACTLAMALAAWENQTNVGGCTGVTPGVQTISLPAGVFDVSDGLTIGTPASAPNASLQIIGQGITATTLEAEGAAATAALTLNGGVTAWVSQLTIRGTSLTGATSGVYGDADALVTLDHVLVTGFTASGVWNENANLTIQWSTIDGNSNSMTGGGIYQAAQDLNAMPETIVNYSTISNNQAPLGGGIYNLGYLNLTYSTVASNTATAGKGGGIYHSADYLQTAHCTIAFNSATATGSGGGVYVDPSIASNVHVNSSIISNNTATSNGKDYSGLLRDANTYPIDPDVLGLEDGVTGGWAEGTDSGGVAGDILGEAKISPLADNGGPTQTCAIVTQDSDAVDQSIAGSPPGSPTDQRGFSAPVGAAYDVGAFEWRP